MRRVAIAQPYVPTYSLAFFDGLVEALGNDDIAVTVFHSPGLSQARTRGDVERPPWSVAVSAREFAIGGRGFIARRLPPQAREADLLILEQALGKSDMLELLLPRRRRPIAMLGHGHIHNRATSAGEEAVLRRLTQLVDWFFAYTPSARVDALAAGVPRSRITVFENSSDTATLAAHARSVSPAEADEARHRFGLADAPVLLFLGSIDDSKRPEFLTDALQEVWRRRPDARLVLVGEGSAAEQLQTADPRVVRAGRMIGRPLAVIASLADAIVMPGRVGLVATDSFALGVPIVTTNWKFHSPEFDYLVDGVNSVITPDDSAQYAAAVVRLLANADELARLRAGCRESARRYSTQNMVELFRLGVLGALAAGPRPRRRTLMRSTAKRIVVRIPPLRRRLFTSTDYAVGALGDDCQRGWDSLRAARRQDKAWRAIVDRALHGDAREDVVALWASLDSIASASSILELGSGHGYLADLVHHRRPEMRYIGVDISLTMCQVALLRRPGVSLVVGDAVALPFADQSVDVVLDAATLMHVRDWRVALGEQARVARNNVILHSVTLADIPDALEMQKYAYGVPVFEAVLSRGQLIRALEGSGFVLERCFPSLDYDLHVQIGVRTVSETWVCARRVQ